MQELLQHLASSDKKVAVASLASELEGAFVRAVTLEVRGDRDLEVTLDPFRETVELRRVVQAR